jgi:hypothetical protein
LKKANNFLDLLFIRKDSFIEVDIYGKSTTMDTTINFLLNHPIEHEAAAYRYDITRMQSLPVSREWKQKG